MRLTQRYGMDPDVATLLRCAPAVVAKALFHVLRVDRLQARTMAQLAAQQRLNPHQHRAVQAQCQAFVPAQLSGPARGGARRLNIA